MLNHQYVCHKCDKGLSSRQSLYRHTQKCADKPTMKNLVREVSSNDIGEQDVPINRLGDDGAGLNAADKTNKPSESPKIQSLLDEFINDNSNKEQCRSQGRSQGRSQKTKFSQKKVKPLAEMNVLPKPPPEIVGISR